VQDLPERTVEGGAEPAEDLALFGYSPLVGEGSHTLFRAHVVICYDDHDECAAATTRRASRPMPGSGRWRPR